MKSTFGSLLCLVLVSCATSPQYTVKVLKHYPDYYAEWGERDGKEYEDRYDAIECEVLSGKKHICDLAVYQHWFKENRKDYPPVGTEIQIRQCDFKERSFSPARGPYTIEMDEFEKLRMDGSNHTSEGIRQPADGSPKPSI